MIVKEALANGRLSPRGEIEPLARAASRLGVSEDAVAIAAVLARPWVDTVLSGASTVAQLESNLGGIRIEWDSALEEELATLTESPDDYWNIRSSLVWS